MNVPGQTLWRTTDLGSCLSLVRDIGSVDEECWNFRLVNYRGTLNEGYRCSESIYLDRQLPRKSYRSRAYIEVQPADLFVGTICTHSNTDHV